MSCPGGTAPLDSHLERLFGRLNYERLSSTSYRLSDFKRGRMAQLLDRLGDPQLRTPAVHVAGSKGKGSVCAMTAAGLRAAGHKVGLFTSPHVHHFSERINVDGAPVDAPTLSAAFEAVWPAVEALDAEDVTPTFFEIATALAWRTFVDSACQTAVLEVGLGGRLDSTNLCAPVATAVTSISRDHGHLLGNGLGEIAVEKAGILKPGVPVVSGADAPAAAEVVVRRAEELDCPLWRVGEEVRVESVREGDRGDEITVHTPARRHLNVPVPLPGRHQHANAAVAIALLDLVVPSVDSRLLAEAIAAVRCPLRIEVVASDPTVVLDAAHNGASVRALLNELQARPERGPRVGLFGTSSDKHIDDMLEEIDHGGLDRLIVTAYGSNPRALPAAELAAAAEQSLSLPVELAESADVGFGRALELAKDNGLVAVFGSFFLAGELRERLVVDRL